MQAIKEQFKRVIQYSQEIENPMIEELFNRWEQSKSVFISLFGGLIYEFPNEIEFTLDEHVQKSMAMEFANTVHETYNNPVLSEFIDENLDSFFANRVTNTLGEKIPVGMKLTKAFKFFESDKKKLRSIQDEASQMLQKNKVKGKLCFSVHPLDFLSSSENTYNWRSCHALDGEYRAGNLSYMVDEVTCLVYLKGAEDVKLPNFPSDVPWNSKKWRMLLHVHPGGEIMFAGRQYPLSSESGICTVLQIFNDLLDRSPDHPTQYSQWSAMYVDQWEDDDGLHDLVEKYLLFNGYLAPLSDIVKQARGALNYNDILESSCYTRPYFAVGRGFWRTPHNMLRNPMQIGGPVYCLHCGANHITYSEIMRCHDCELEYGTDDGSNYTSCDCCGTRIYVDDGIWVGDDIVCESCLDSQCFFCEDCGDYYFKEDRVYEKDGNFCCVYCHENNETREEE